MRSIEDEATLMEVDAFYARVHGIMKNRGLEWKDMARRMGIDESTLSMMRKTRKVPDVLTMRKISDALGVTFDELFGSSGKGGIHDTYWAGSGLKDSVPPCFYAREVAYYKVAEKDEEPGDDVVYVEEIREEKDLNDEQPDPRS